MNPAFAPVIRPAGTAAGRQQFRARKNGLQVLQVQGGWLQLTDRLPDGLQILQCAIQVKAAAPDACCTTAPASSRALWRCSRPTRTAQPMATEAGSARVGCSVPTTCSNIRMRPLRAL